MGKQGAIYPLCVMLHVMFGACFLLF